MRLLLITLICSLLIGCTAEKVAMPQTSEPANEPVAVVDDDVATEPVDEPKIEEIDTDLMDEDIDFDATDFEDW